MAHRDPALLARMEGAAKTCQNGTRRARQALEARCGTPQHACTGCRLLILNLLS